MELNLTGQILFVLGTILLHIGIAYWLSHFKKSAEYDVIKANIAVITEKTETIKVQLSVLSHRQIEWNQEVKKSILEFYIAYSNWYHAISLCRYESADDFFSDIDNANGCGKEYLAAQAKFLLINNPNAAITQAITNQFDATGAFINFMLTTGNLLLHHPPLLLDQNAKQTRDAQYMVHTQQTVARQTIVNDMLRELLTQGLD
jgi:hypothetical protein